MSTFMAGRAVLAADDAIRQLKDIGAMVMRLTLQLEVGPKVYGDPTTVVV